jgi:hypothetical protein
MFTGAPSHHHVTIMLATQHRNRPPASFIVGPGTSLKGKERIGIPRACVVAKHHATFCTLAQLTLDKSRQFGSFLHHRLAIGGRIADPIGWRKSHFSVPNIS